jgi:hypothetical protein
LRLALAYLASRAVSYTELNRSSFNEFWWYLTSKEPVGRWQNLNRTLNGIYGALGLERDDRRTSHFEKQAKLARGRGSGADEAANHEIVSGDLFQ